MIELKPLHNEWKTKNNAKEFYWAGFKVAVIENASSPNSPDFCNKVHIGLYGETYIGELEDGQCYNNTIRELQNYIEENIKSTIKHIKEGFKVQSSDNIKMKSCHTYKNGRIEVIIEVNGRDHYFNHYLEEEEKDIYVEGVG